VRDAQELGLGAAEVAAEEPRTHVLEVLAELRLTGAAEPARSARDDERDDDPVPHADALDAGADGLHDPDSLVPDALAGVERRLAVDVVEVRAADRRERHAHDRVVGFDEDRVGTSATATLPTSS